eukprot:RCo053148
MGDRPKRTRSRTDSCEAKSDAPAAVCRHPRKCGSGATPAAEPKGNTKRQKAPSSPKAKRCKPEAQSCPGTPESASSSCAVVKKVKKEPGEGDEKKSCRPRFKDNVRPASEEDSMIATLEKKFRGTGFNPPCAIFHDRSEFTEGLITTDCTYTDPKTGAFVAWFRKAVLPLEELNKVAPIFESMTDEKIEEKKPYLSPNGVNTTARRGLGGWFDYLGGRMTPKVIETKYTRKHPKEWADVAAFAELVCNTFKNICPQQYEDQRKKTPDYEGLCLIGKSLYSTVAVLRNYRREGCYLGLPDYKICFDLRPGDLMIFNSHLKHCNTEVLTTDPKWHRLNAVFFFRRVLHEEICRDIMAARRAEALRRKPRARGEELTQLIRQIIQEEYDQEQARKAAKCAQTHSQRAADPDWKLWRCLKMWKKLSTLKPEARREEYFNETTREWLHDKLHSDLVALCHRGRVLQYTLPPEWFEERLGVPGTEPPHRAPHIAEYLRCRAAWWKP